MFRIAKKISASSIGQKEHLKDEIKQSELEIFKNHSFLVLQNGMGKNRAELFKSLILKYGGALLDEKNEIKNELSNIFIIFDDQTIKDWISLEKILSKKAFYDSLIKNDLKFKVLSSRWLSECLKQKLLIDLKSFELIKPLTEKGVEEKNSRKKSCNESDSEDEKYERSKKLKLCVKQNNVIDQHSSYSEDSDTENVEDEEFQLELKNKSKNNSNWTCAHSSKEQSNVNKHITDKLEEIMSIYEIIKDKFRALGYQKALIALKRYPKVIETYEEALAIPGVGQKVAEKVWEIVETGHLKNLVELNSREDIRAIKLFTTIHGVGPSVAQTFVAQGLRSIDDLKLNAHLTRQQKIGLKYREEFIQRIPRDEVEKIEKIVTFK
jgi:DNA polymerase lambda